MAGDAPYSFEIDSREKLYSVHRYRRSLIKHCTQVSATASRHHLRSAASHQFVVPPCRLSSYGRRAFSVAGPMIWNSLPRHLRDPIHTISVFGRLLKTLICVLQGANVSNALRAFLICCCFT